MIGGLQSCSFIDYPGHLSAVVFLNGCNLRCPYCHNPSLLAPQRPSRQSDDEVLSFLESRCDRLDGVVITGGEPTLHRGLRPFIESVRQLGFRIKLDTNGTRPSVLEGLFERGLLDYVAMDLKDEPSAYVDWLGMRKAPKTLIRSIEVIRSSGIDHELRTTVVMPRHDATRLDRMAHFAAGVERWVLQAFRAGTTLRNGLAFGSPSVHDLNNMADMIRRKHGLNCLCRGAANRGNT